MRAVYCCLFILAAAVAAKADLAADVQACKAETDSLRRLSCFDAIKIEMAVKAAQPTGRSAGLGSVVMTDVSLRIQDKDPSSQVYNDRIEIQPTFKNNTQKTVVALEHTLVVTNAFGEPVVDGKSKLDIKIAPGQTVVSDNFYFFDDNPFIHDEVFDKLSGPIRTGVAKARMTVTKAVFSDGTIEVYK